MLKFPNTRYSKAWKQHVKPPSEMEYSRVINRKRWEEAIPCIWGNYEAQCLPAALARPSFVENSGRVKAARTNSTPLPREFLPSFRVATTAFASVLMSANIVAEWRGCAARFAFPFLGGASWMREGERERGNSAGKKLIHLLVARGDPLLSCEKWFPVSRAVSKETKNQGHGR